MKRALMVLAVVVAAGVGAYGQTARNTAVQNYEVFDYAGIYRASMCADKVFIGGGAIAANFMMRVKRPLANNWLEVDVSSWVTEDNKALREPVETIRINAAKLCYIKPMVP